MYSISDYGDMLADKGRMGPYIAALKKYVRSDSVVLDIGTGTGVFALLACQFGARHVYAVESNSAIEVGAEMARANGYSSKITFIQNLSTHISLPEKADLILSDLRGELPLYTHNIPSVIDARQRHLAEGGVLIPERDTIRVALVESPELYDQYTLPWSGNSLGLDLQEALPWVTNAFWSKNFSASKNERIVGDEQVWAILDYKTIENPHVEGELDWVMEEDVTVHGIRLWFDAELAEDISLSNHPMNNEMVYGNSFLPFAEPLCLRVGDKVAMGIQARLVGDDYIWRWQTRVRKQKNLEEVTVAFEQTNFNEMPVSLSLLQKRAHNFQPELTEEGELSLEVMLMMKQGFSLSRIAQSLLERFPGRFSDWQDALPMVGKLSEKYSK